MSCLCSRFSKKKESKLTRIIKGIPQTPSYTLQRKDDNENEYEFASDKNNNNNTLCRMFPHITTKIFKMQIPFSKECINVIYVHTAIPSKTNHTIIYSHGIRSDIGSDLPLLIDLSIIHATIRYNLL